MPRSDEIQAALRVLFDMFDVSDPVAWREVITRVLQSGDMTYILDGQLLAANPQLRTFRELYLQWKERIAASYLSADRAFGRFFWRELTDPQRNTLEPMLSDFPPGGSLQSLATAVEGLPIDLLVHLAAGGTFADTCASVLMGEVLEEHHRRPLTKAEELNDAGFDRHAAGLYSEALPFHEQAIELSPEFSLAWINKGICLKNLRRYNEAIQCYDHVIDNIDPEYKKAWHNKGVALMELRSWDRALECFDRALQIDPEYRIAQQVRAKCLEARQRCGHNGPVAKAVRAFLEEFQHDAEVMQLLEMAQQLLARGQLEAACRLWQQLAEKTGQHAVILAALADTLYELGRKEEAFEKLQAAVEKDGRCGPAWVSLTRHYLERRDFPAGLEAAEQAVVHAADDPTAWANRAGVLFGLRRFEEGMESARHALAMDDRNPWALYYLGVCARESGQREEARKALQRLVSTSGHPDLVRSARSILAHL